MKPHLSATRIQLGSWLILLVTLCALLGCAPQQLPQDISQQRSVTLPVRVDSIIFVDRRPDTLTAAMNLPVIATRGREWTVVPGLSGSLQREIVEMIKRASDSSGPPCSVTVYIVDGYYKIRGNSTQVQEYTKFDSELAFELIDGTGGFKTSASAHNELIGIFNATEDHVKDMYRITVRNSIFTALTYARKP